MQTTNYACDKCGKLLREHEVQMSIIIYISGPYSNGDSIYNPEILLDNVHKAEDAAIQLIDAGLLVFIPLQSHYIHARHPRVYGAWLKYDLCWLDKCDYLLRLPGDSKGADREVAYAKEKNIMVFYSIEALLNHLKRLSY